MMDMTRTDAGFDGDDGPLLDQYAIAMKAYEDIKAYVSYLQRTIPPVDSNQKDRTKFWEEVLRVSNVAIPSIQGELQAVDLSGLTDDQKRILTEARYGLETISVQLYNLLYSLPK